MALLEDLKPNAAVKGVLPDALVAVVAAKWFGSSAVELTYKDPSGRVASEILYRDREPSLEVVAAGRPWSFDGDGAAFRLVSEAHRIRLAHLFDPVLAVHTSVVDPLPHQITAVYEAMLPRQPLRFLLADDPGAVTARLPETYQWLLVPVQAKPTDPVEWQASRLSGQDPLAVRASKKLRSDDRLVARLAASSLRMELDSVPLWRGDHVPIRQLTHDFGQYLYLPRLKDSSVLAQAIREGFATLTWEQDSFAYADSYDEAASRYRGLRGGENVAVSEGDAGLLVRPTAARRQMDEEAARAKPNPPPDGVGAAATPSDHSGPTARFGSGRDGPPIPAAPGPRTLRRFHGTVILEAERAGRDAGRIHDEVIAHLTGLVGASVRVTLEIEADIPDGAPENVVRNVNENSRALKFTNAGFEES